MGRLAAAERRFRAAVRDFEVTLRSARVLGLVFFCSLLAGENAWRADAANAGASPLALVAVSRHGVRSPTNATEMDAYAARP